MINISPARLNSLYPAGYLTEANVADLVGDEASKFNKLNLLAKKGVLVRLRRGFYILGEHYRSTPANEFVISNHLYGPSYVSLESALSFHGLIPEATVEVTAVNPKRVKNYRTPIGRFSYRKIPAEAFPAALEVADHAGHFIIASAEKALVDKLYLDGPSQLSVSYLTDSLRIDEVTLERLRWARVRELASLYNKAFERRLRDLFMQLEKEK